MEIQAIHPADTADQLQRLPLEEAVEAFQHLPETEASRVLSEWDETQLPDLLESLPSSHLRRWLQIMPPADAVDTLEHCSEEKRSEVMTGLPRETFVRLSNLLRYPADTAGGIMSDQYITLHADQTVGECQQLLRSRAEESTDGVSYLYVTDASDRLVGIVSLRDLVFRRPERRIGEIMAGEVKHVRVDDDQEKIARLFQQYHYLGLPVLDEAGRLVGVVSADQVIEVVRSEATEDMQLMVGLSGEERALTPWQDSIRKRLPWLCVNLGTAFMAGAVVSIFEGTIAKWTALAIFLPIVAGQGGNAGAQTLTVIIRGMALGELNKGDGRKALYKELMLGTLNGLAIGLLVAVAGYLWKQEFLLGVVVGVAMVLNMVAAALSGVFVPYTLKALRIDPALASSILVTTVTDVAGFFFFLGLAALALRWFPQ